ncbi:MAG: NgoMIV family type II restriction endonuclease [Pyrinomonadaceae bacterium]
MKKVKKDESVLSKIRKQYHEALLADVIRIRKNAKKHTESPNFADSSSASSSTIAWNILRQIGGSEDHSNLSDQTLGKRFEEKTRDYLEKAFGELQHLRPGKWSYTVGEKKVSIADFDQYEHLISWAKFVEQLEKQDAFLASSFGGGYIVKPDIVIGRKSVTDSEINVSGRNIVGKDGLASHTPLRSGNCGGREILHASISCKWTIRSDRSQNARTEALNLIRNRRGNLPHIIAVTAEPMPTRLITLALGTGDLDCVYHFALQELKTAVLEVGNDEQREAFENMMQSRRLRDISDVPFDLAI